MRDHELWPEIEEVMVHILKITRADMSILENRVGRI